MTRDEADAALAQAIRDHARAYELGEADEMLDDFAVIAHWQRVEADGDSPYTTHYTRSPMPTHVAVGLFSVGADIASTGGD